MSDDAVILITLLFINISFIFLTLNSVLFFKDITKMGLGFSAKFINIILIFFSTIILIGSIACTCIMINRIFF